ncbi:MAG: hypothetical protein RL088_2788 [Verrucomicrobiota bacterium]|jgi:hypothetical protein
MTPVIPETAAVLRSIQSVAGASPRSVSINSGNDVLREVCLSDCIHPLSDCVYPLSDCVYPLSDCVYPLSDCVYPLSDCVYPLSDCVHPLSDCVYPLTDCVYPFAICFVQVNDCVTPSTGRSRPLRDKSRRLRRGRVPALHGALRAGGRTGTGAARSRPGPVCEDGWATPLAPDDCPLPTAHSRFLPAH